MNVKQIVSRNIINYSGWTTNRRIVVIESDDWGSIRMPSKVVYNKLLGQGISVDKCPYNKYDSLETKEDLINLFDVLNKYKDKNGNHPVVTANTVVANPDFKRIEESNFQKYFYKSFPEIYKEYPNCDNDLVLWNEGIKSKIFHPQFHGREHVNVSMWLRLLQENNPLYLKAFNNKMWGLGPSISGIKGVNIQAAFDCKNVDEIEFQKFNIKKGLNLFEEIFSFKSKSFIANNFIWDTSLENVLKEEGVLFIQGMKYQLLPRFENSVRLRKRHFLGSRNQLDQIYLIRNCEFEPTQHNNFDNVNKCLADIGNAFFWKKPAIVSSHRLNFIGSLDMKNREENLKGLDSLLKKIIQKWPDVEFMNTEELGNLINDDTKK